MSDTDHESTPPVPDATVPEPTGTDGEPGDAAWPDPEIIGASETMPPIPEEIRDAARAAPDHWLGMVDPNWSGEGAPPDWALVGRWRSGLDGEIVEWQDNEDYRPSPTALGWPDPTDEVDEAVQLAATGYGPGDTVISALAAHEVAVFTQLGGGPLPALTPDGTPVVPVFTSPVHLNAAGRLAFELVKVPDLLDQVPPDHLLYLNPSGPVSMTVEPDVLREEIAGTPADTPADTPAAAEEEASAAPRPVPPIATVSGSPDSHPSPAAPSGDDPPAAAEADPGSAERPQQADEIQGVDEMREADGTSKADEVREAGA